MKNLNLSFSITSVILGGNLLILSPVLGQTNLISNSEELPSVTYNPESEPEETTIEQIERLYSLSSRFG